MGSYLGAVVASCWKLSKVEKQAVTKEIPQTFDATYMQAAHDPRQSADLESVIILFGYRCFLAEGLSLPNGQCARIHAVLAVPSGC